MSHEVEVGWKIKVKRAAGQVEIEVVGMNAEKTKAWFDELEKKYL